MTHASTFSLARYQAGDLSERRSAAVSKHLSTCARCTRLSEELSAIPAALASVQPPPMPGIALTRISAALATEAARRAERGMAAAGAARADTGGTGPGDAGQRSGKAGRRVRPFRIPKLRPLSAPVALRVAAAAAAAVVLAGGGYGLYQLSIPRGTATAAGRGSSLAPPAPHIREPLAAAGGGVTVYYRRGGHLAAALVEPTGTNFQQGTLARDVRASLAVQAGPGKVIYGTHSAPGAAGSQALSGFMGGIRIASLPGCVGRIAAGHRVIGADIGRYQGRPAIVIALAVPQSALANIWVVGAGCSAARSDVLARARARI